MSSGRHSVSTPTSGEKGKLKDKGKRKLPDLDVVGGAISAHGQLHVVMRDMHFEFSDDERSRLCAAGLSNIDTLHWWEPVIWQLVDEDDDEAEDIQKAEGADNLLEVRKPKDSDTSVARRSRRENVLEYGAWKELLRSTAGASSSRVPKDSNVEDISIEKLGKIILVIVIVLCNPNRLHMYSEDVGDDHGEAAECVNKEEPSEWAERCGVAKSDQNLEGVEFNVASEHGGAGERQCREGEEVDCLDKAKGIKEFELGGPVERQGGEGRHSDCRDQAQSNKDFDGGAADERHVHEAGAAPDAGIDLNEAHSPEYEISDLATYEPDNSPGNKSVKLPPKKRLFDEVEGYVQPSYGVICAGPLPKKLKTRGKKIMQSKLVKLASLRDQRFSLPTQCKSEADVKWFVQLHTTKGWLSDEQTLMLDTMDQVPERIMPFVEGEYPHQGGKAWHEVDHVYRIGNIRENHCLLYRLDLNEQRGQDTKANTEEGVGPSEIRAPSIVDQPV
ncbi:hypothetical protein C2S52_007166 [Perilla frutescens var. hirtella]|nr:hypothetical protein C2S52_007166 [Perilla frutescens var. hirtella]